MIHHASPDSNRNIVREFGEWSVGAGTTPRKYVFHVTSIGESLSPWTCKLNESPDNISPRVQPPFS